MPSDEELMRRYVDGDEQAFSELYRRYGGPVLGLMRRGYLNRSDAEDLVQQTFLQLHRARFDFRFDSPVRPWLMTIARNVKRDHLRRLRRRKPMLDLDVHEPAAEDPAAARLEARELVRRALPRLPATMRAVVELHWLEQLPFARVAERLGISRSAAKVRAHRAYQALRRHVEDLKSRHAAPCSRPPLADVSEDERP